MFHRDFHLLEAKFNSKQVCKVNISQDVPNILSVYIYVQSVDIQIYSKYIQKN